MKRNWLPRVLLSVVLGSGCSASHQGRDARGSGDSPGDGAGQVDPIGRVIRAAPGTATHTGGHTFTPRAHPPHVAATAKPVALGDLPPSVTAFEQCFSQFETSSAKPLPRAPSRPSTGPLVLGRGRSGAAAPEAPPAPSGAGAAPPTAAPALEVAPAEARPAARDDAKRKEERQRSSSEEPGAPVVVDAAQPSAGDEQRAFGASIYLSNDDSMSLSSAQRVIYAIDNFLPIPREHVRPHEVLNYFSFDTAPVGPHSDFSVHAEIAPKPNAPGMYTLGLAIAGRNPSREERRHAALTFVIDRSGSMLEQGRMEYVKQGLLRMTDELKPGDLINLVIFDDRVCSPIQNFVVGRDSMDVLRSGIDALAPRGSTDVHAGLVRGYALANASYQATHSNRVILITDALANTGVTDHETIALIGDNYDQRRIRLSGVGVGAEFNDGLLDTLTERGRGAYVFLGSPAEVNAVFGTRFTSLIETVANDVHFKLHLPPSLAMDVFYGEESSTHKEDVRAIHYFAGTSQLFLSDLRARDSELRLEDGVMLGIEYQHPETGVSQVEEYAFRLADLSGPSRNIAKGRLVMSFIDGVADTLRSEPRQVEFRPGGWVDDAAVVQCERGRESLAMQSQKLSDDPEVRRVVQLWNKYCSRYPERDAVRQPVRRAPPRGREVWPSAQQ